MATMLFFMYPNTHFVATTNASGVGKMLLDMGFIEISRKEHRRHKRVASAIFESDMGVESSHWLRNRLRKGPFADENE